MFVMHLRTMAEMLEHPQNPIAPRENGALFVMVRPELVFVQFPEGERRMTAPSCWNRAFFHWISTLAMMYCPTVIGSQGTCNKFDLGRRELSAGNKYTNIRMGSTVIASSKCEATVRLAGRVCPTANTL